MTTAIGLITLAPLEGTNPAPAPLQLTTDPEGYVRDWETRKSVIPVFDGAVTQDFGRYAADMTITLTWSGNGQWLDGEAVRTLRTWQGFGGGTYQFTDDEGNDFTVEMVPPFREAREFGMPDWYRATITLHVLAIAMLFGEIYTGG